MEMDKSFNGIRGGKIPPEVKHEEFDEVDHKMTNIFEDIRIVSKRISLQEDKILAEFIYNHEVFNKHYVADVKDIMSIFNFYLSFAPVVADLRRNKLPNIIIRKIKSIRWKLKRRKKIKKMLGE